MTGGAAFDTGIMGKAVYVYSCRGHADRKPPQQYTYNPGYRVARETYGETTPSLFSNAQNIVECENLFLKNIKN